MMMMRIVLFLSLSLACLSLDASCSPPPAAAAACAGVGTTTPFCGSCCCSAEDDLKLREAFLAEVKAHGYEDAACRSQQKAYICAMCVSAAAPSPPSTLPLRCADDTHTRAPTSSLLKWIFGVIGSLIAILGGGYRAYRYMTCSCFNRVNVTNVNIHNGENKIQLTVIGTEG